jgi:hypothetical protein
MDTRLPSMLCATRAQKNLRWIMHNVPQALKGTEPAGGWGSVIPVSVLAHLHQSIPRSYDGPLDLARLEQIRFPAINAALSEPVFSGTVHFVQINFAVQPSNNIVAVPMADLQTAVNYATKAGPILAKYTSQYGATSIPISPSILTYNVTLTGTSYSDTNVQNWVNAIKNAHALPGGDCVAILNPAGVTNTNADLSQGVLGYHGKSDIPYVFANVQGTGLTLDDAKNVYAAALSHETAEMAVDPAADDVNPEVCDPCAGNCNNLWLAFFDASSNYLGSKQTLPPGFSYDFFTSTVVKPSSATSCPAPQADCAYSPIPPAPPAVSNARGYLATVPRVVFRTGDGHIHEFSINQATQTWQQFDMTVATRAALASGDPQGYLGNVARVVYLASDSHIHEIALNPAGWQSFDMTVATGAPPAAGNPFGYFATVPRVVFRTGDGHIHEFSINQATQTWQQFDMTVATRAALASGDPQGYLGNVARVVYLASDSHIHEIALNPAGWQSFDMTVATGAPPAAGNPFGYFATVPRVVFRTGDGHIHEFSINQATQTWQQFDMTVAT